MKYFIHKTCFLQIAREVLDAAARVIRPGITTDEIDAVVHEATIAAGTVTLSVNPQMKYSFAYWNLIYSSCNLQPMPIKIL